jgi:hypothetical protein
MNTTPAKETAEGRRAPRERTFLPARVSFGERGALSTQCTVTQLSAVGARLNVPASVTMPDRFEVSIPQRGLNYRARLVWRKGDLVGVEFEMPEAQAAPTQEDLQAKVRELEATNAKLRARIAELVDQVTRLTEA